MIGKRAQIVISAVLLLLLLAGLVRLFQLRFREGDIYPPYSTLRSDPLGTKAFYQALSELPGYRVERHHRSWRWLPEPEERTLFLLGVGRGLVERLERRRDESGREESFLLDWVRDGGRCVIAVRPRLENESRAAYERESGADSGEGTGDSGNEPPLRDGGERFFPEIRFHRDGPSGSEALRSWEDGGVETALFTWRSGVYFDASEAGSAWRVLLEAGEHPVGIRRDHGAGEVLMIADTFPFSNEAMLRERRTDFLTFALGDRRRASFEESHLGVSDSTGIAMLARRYDFEGVFLAAVFLALVFVWRSSYSLLPRRNQPAGTGEVVAGKGAAEGLQLLLRRGGSAGDLLEEGIRDWRFSSHFLGLPGWKRREVENFLKSNESSGRSAADTYEAIRTLVEKKRP